MKVYLLSQTTFGDREDLFKTILNLPPYSLYHIVTVELSEIHRVYQLNVYIFDDEFDVSDYAPKPF